MSDNTTLKRGPFLAGVFLVTFASLLFQIVQTRVLSVIAWYYLAFFAISVAMLGMTAGAVWVYLKGAKLDEQGLARALARNALLCAVAMPLSLMLQFVLVIKLTPTFTTLAAWVILMSAMTVPYFFSGIVVSLALTRSPFPVNQVYGVDLLGAALGCVAVIPVLNALDGPSTIIVAGAVCALAAGCFGASSATALPRKGWISATAILAAAAIFSSATPLGLQPLMVKDEFEPLPAQRYEEWNSYSRIMATRPDHTWPLLWGPSPAKPVTEYTDVIALNIDGLAGTQMYKYDGTEASVAFLKRDLVNLAYSLPGINKSAVIGVGGGRDVLSAHLFGVKDITGVELNPIFVRMHTQMPAYRDFSNLQKIPDLKLHVDDARSWFASTKESYDLIQMSMIDTWSATGAGAFSLSENGLYTLEGWRAFIGRLNPNGLFTVSRWYNPGDNNETGRMIALATAAVLDTGASDAQKQLFVATTGRIATLVLSRAPFTAEQLATLRAKIDEMGYSVLLAPDQPPASDLLKAILAAHTVEEIDRATADAFLDLSVATDNRPFFFNQLRPRNIVESTKRMMRNQLGRGVLSGNLVATAALVLILLISIVAVVLTIVLPLRGALKGSSQRFIVAGTAYFALIGMGFMFTEISLLQHFSVYLGHPIYSLGVCLFSLILSTGLGSLASDRLHSGSRTAMIVWSAVVGVALLVLPHVLPDIFAATTADPRGTRIAISLAVVIPIGFLLGFAFPVGMRLVESLDRGPAPWFWGINGACGVLASVLAVMLSMVWGITLTMTAAALCYLLLLPAALALEALLRQRAIAT